jgi:hypothetical protein
LVLFALAFLTRGSMKARQIKQPNKTGAERGATLLKKEEVGQFNETDVEEVTALKDE